MTPSILREKVHLPARGGVEPEGLHPRQGRHTQGTHQVQLLTNLDALTAHYRVLSHLVCTQDDPLSQDLQASQHILTKDGRHAQVKATHKVHTCYDQDRF